MNCEEIQELILTDYLDGEMNDDQKIRMSIHFARCHHCKEFFLKAKESVVEAFAQVDTVTPPEIIWQRVKEAIMTEQQKKAGFADTFLEKLKSLLYISKPSFAVLTIITLILVIGVMAQLGVNHQKVLKGNVEAEKIEAFMYSVETPVGLLMSGDTGFGTSIEEYFL